jgi:hypothetical protein
MNDVRSRQLSRARFALLAGVYAVGVILTLVALFCVTASFATTDYRPILRFVVLLSVIAAGCLGYVVWFGRPAWRTAAFLTALPLAYALIDALGRMR